MTRPAFRGHSTQLSRTLISKSSLLMPLPPVRLHRRCDHFPIPQRLPHLPAPLGRALDDLLHLAARVLFALLTSFAAPSPSLSFPAATSTAVPMKALRVPLGPAIHGGM